jgi:hypothetical protein
LEIKGERKERKNMGKCFVNRHNIEGLTNFGNKESERERRK